MRKHSGIDRLKRKAANQAPKIDSPDRQRRTEKPLRKADGRRKSGKRVPLVDPEELRAWLVRKGEVRCRDQETGQDVPGGFCLVGDRPLEIRPQPSSHFRKKGQHGCHGGVQFRGVLEVVDREHFRRTYQAGIGSAKGFGFGLLLLAPVTL